MGNEVILPGDPPIELVLKPSARARRLSLRVSRLDGRVTLTLPKNASRRHALAFAEDQAGWIRRQLAGQAQGTRPMPGTQLPIGGEAQKILTNHGLRSPRLTEAGIEVPARDPERTPARLAAFLKLEARSALAEAVEHYADALGVTHGKITLRDTRSRWGSCSSTGDLMFSWRLIMAPPEVLDYVVAHEVAHLIEMNHSRAFWAVVAQVCPDYKAPRQWLHDNAPSLHRYRFRD
ncbi:MAG: SprT family zinc-dependent metalloprotease [Maritimibacter sp.]